MTYVVVFGLYADLRFVQITFCDGGTFFGFFDVINFCRAARREKDSWRRGVLDMFITSSGRISFFWFSTFASKPLKSYKKGQNWPTESLEKEKKAQRNYLWLIEAACDLNELYSSLHDRYLVFSPHTFCYGIFLWKSNILNNVIFLYVYYYYHLITRLPIPSWKRLQHRHERRVNFEVCGELALFKIEYSAPFRYLLSVRGSPRQRNIMRYHSSSDWKLLFNTHGLKEKRLWQMILWTDNR